MPILLAVTYLNALVTTARAGIRRRTDSEAGATTLELVILILGLIAVAALVVGVVTAAVQRRVDQIN